jgi:predicted acetyltransferase
MAPTLLHTGGILPSSLLGNGMADAPASLTSEAETDRRGGPPHWCRFPHSGRPAAACYRRVTMNANLLIDMVVRQTIVFIAQLATAPGTRASLAHVADRVFGELVAELRDQGVGAKVIASMFGMALSTWQQRVRRCQESATDRGRTLWEAVLTHVGEHDRVTKLQILERFRHDDEGMVRAVLRELRETGLLSVAGRGDSAAYRLEPLAPDLTGPGALAALLRVAVYHAAPATLDALVRGTGAGVEEVARALDALEAAGEVTRSTDASGAAVYTCETYLIPLAASAGWEAAVFDHFQAVVSTLCARIALGPGRTRATDETGGSTYSFDLLSDHPREDEVRGLLREMRARLSALRQAVDADTVRLGRPADGQGCAKVTFYFGQMVQGDETWEKGRVS